MVKSTPKQVRYAIILLARNGYSTEYMNSRFKELGASMRERSGSVEGWLSSMNVARISALIDTLKSMES